MLVSALLFDRSVPAQAVFAGLDAGEILLSETLVNEINEILQRRKFEPYVSAEQREEFLIALVQSGTLVELRKRSLHAAAQKIITFLNWQSAVALTVRAASTTVRDGRSL